MIYKRLVINLAPMPRPLFIHVGMVAITHTDTKAYVPFEMDGGPSIVAEGANGSTEEIIGNCMV